MFFHAEILLYMIEIRHLVNLIFLERNLPRKKAEPLFSWACCPQENPSRGENLPRQQIIIEKLDVVSIYMVGFYVYKHLIKCL